MRKREMLSGKTEAQPNDQDTELSTQRIEAFSDGVFAIAITLLILEIKIPHPQSLGPGQRLQPALLALWPSYVAYLFSFVIIGIYWANHHYIFKLYKRTDHLFNLLNVLFLMCISFLPFPTAILGEFVLGGRERQTAVLFYTLGLLLPAFAWFLMWLYASHDYRLIDIRLREDFVSHLTRQYLLSNLLYGAAFVISFWNASVGLAVSAGLTLLYLLPPKKPEYRSH